MRMKNSTRPANLSLDTVLLDRAKALNINISRACETGLAREVSEAEAKLWQEENEEFISSYNRHIAENGIFLAEHRTF
jgi:antitoxin CcdA